MSDMRDVVAAAAQSGDLDQLTRLAREHGYDLIRADDDPNALTTLHLAAAAGHQSVVDWLLSEDVGADPAALRRNHFSPLHGAAMNGHARVCQTLLISGAKANVQTDPQGYAPLHSAAWGGHTEAAKVLLANGARTDVRNYRGETPAETALRQGHSALVQLLPGGRATPEQNPWWKFWQSVRPVVRKEINPCLIEMHLLGLRASCGARWKSKDSLRVGI